VVEGSAPPSTAKWYYRTWSVVLLLFLVLGPFGLPLLWRSPSFSRGMKLALTIVVLAYSVVLFEAVLAAVRLALEQVDTLGLAGTADYSCRSLPTAPSLRCAR
jgi:hypothetical protein